MHRWISTGKTAPLQRYREGWTIIRTENADKISDVLTALVGKTAADIPREEDDLHRLVRIFRVCADESVKDLLLRRLSERADCCEEIKAV